MKEEQKFCIKCIIFLVIEVIQKIGKVGNVVKTKQEAGD